MALVGERSRVHKSVKIGVPGFGYMLREDGTWKRKPELTDGPYAMVSIGEDVDIGAGTVIARGSYRPTVIGDGTKIDCLVFIAHNVQIGRNCLIVACAEISGSCEIGDGAIIGPNATIKEHVTIGAGALIGAGSVVLHDVPPGQVWAGVPAHFLRNRRPGEAV